MGLYRFLCGYDDAVTVDGVLDSREAVLVDRDGVEIVLNLGEGAAHAGGVLKAPSSCLTITVDAHNASHAAVKFASTHRNWPRSFGDCLVTVNVPIYLSSDPDNWRLVE